MYAITSETRITGTRETAFSVSTDSISVAGVNTNVTLIDVCRKDYYGSYRINTDETKASEHCKLASYSVLHAMML
jgi:hypothetical protein